MNTFLKLLGCFILLSGIANSKESKQPVDTLTVGTTSGYAPYVSLDNQGQYEGFDIDLAKLVAEKLNRRLVIKDLGSMPGLMVALQQKKIDALIWAVSITEKRQKQMEMIYYQGDKITSIPLLFWEKIPDGIHSVKDLENDPKKTVCVEAGSYQEQILSNYRGLALKNVNQLTDALMEIKFGKSLALAIDNSLVSFVTKQNPKFKVLYSPLPPNEQALGNGVCVHKENKELAAQIRQAVEELRVEGVIQALEKKWNMSANP